MHGLRAAVRAAGRVGSREHGHARGQRRADARLGDRHLALLHCAQQRLHGFISEGLRILLEGFRRFQGFAGVLHEARLCRPVFAGELLWEAQKRTACLPMGVCPLGLLTVMLTPCPTKVQHGNARSGGDPVMTLIALVAALEACGRHALDQRNGALAGQAQGVAAGAPEQGFRV